MIATIRQTLYLGLFSVFLGIGSGYSEQTWASDIQLVGANPSGSKDKSVAAWTGGLPLKPRASHRHHDDPFADEEPLFEITIDNYKQHQDRLSDGLIKLLERFPQTFRIPVYPSHRTATYPDWIFENMRQRDAGKTFLTQEGNAIENPIAGVNFPRPQNGLEAVWNHLTRWRGQFFARDMAEAIVYSNGNKKIFKAKQEVSFELYRNDVTTNNSKQVLLYYLSAITEPANIAGGTLLAVDYLNQHAFPRQSWSYDAGQRRVKRLPNITYDNPAIMAESLRTADDTDMFSGSPDRYEWKLEGRQIMYIPYNSYRLSSHLVSYDDLLTKHHIDPKYTRFEAHRVWKVVATLKPGQYHVYPKRIIYIDEDSWAAMLTEQYDQSGNIWRVSMSHLKSYYEVPLTFSCADVFHDLKSGYYSVSALTNEEKSSGEFNLPYPPASYFSPAGLRSRLKR